MQPVMENDIPTVPADTPFMQLIGQEIKTISIAIRKEISLVAGVGSSLKSVSSLDGWSVVSEDIVVDHLQFIVRRDAFGEEFVKFVCETMKWSAIKQSLPSKIIRFLTPKRHVITFYASSSSTESMYLRLEHGHYGYSFLIREYFKAFGLVYSNQGVTFHPGMGLNMSPIRIHSVISHVGSILGFNQYVSPLTDTMSNKEGFFHSIAYSDAFTPEIYGLNNEGVCVRELEFSNNPKFLEFVEYFRSQVVSRRTSLKYPTLDSARSKVFASLTKTFPKFGLNVNAEIETAVSKQKVSSKLDQVFDSTVEFIELDGADREKFAKVYEDSFDTRSAFNFFIQTSTTETLAMHMKNFMAAQNQQSQAPADQAQN